MTTTGTKIAELQRQARIEARNVEIACHALGRKGAALRLAKIQAEIWRLSEDAGA